MDTNSKDDFNRKEEDRFQIVPFGLWYIWEIESNKIHVGRSPCYHTHLTSKDLFIIARELGITMQDVINSYTEIIIGPYSYIPTVQVYFSGEGKWPFENLFIGSDSLENPAYFALWYRLDSLVCKISRQLEDRRDSVYLHWLIERVFQLLFIKYDIELEFMPQFGKKVLALLEALNDAQRILNLDDEFIGNNDLLLWGGDIF